MLRIGRSLCKEVSKSNSGVLQCYGKIPILKEKNYYTTNQLLDGDAPKQFIRAYFYSKNTSVKRSNLGSWIPYIAKTAEKWYPHESVIEYMINRIGIVLGLRMNDVKLVRANDQIRFLSRYFLKEGERLVHGAEICGAHLNDLLLADEIANDKITARELFTFEFVSKAIETEYPSCFQNIIYDLVKMLAFDAIVGNNDRHFYNWGIIDTSRKTGKNPIFAPIFDSARGLFWNTSDKSVTKQINDRNKGGKQIEKYITKASPRISIEQNKEANHFHLIEFLKRENKVYKEKIDELASVLNEKLVMKMLSKDIFPFFIKERCEATMLVLSERFKKIREV